MKPMIEKSLLQLLLTLALSFTSSLSLANAIDVHQFKNIEEEQRYRQFIDELRCPKCQNQNLSGSNSPIAQDLRRELYRMIQEGESDTNIKSFMVARYGNFVLYEPPLDMNTLALWLSPLIMIIVALLIIFRFKGSHNLSSADEMLSAEEDSKLQEILNKY